MIKFASAHATSKRRHDEVTQEGPRKNRVDYASNGRRHRGAADADWEVLTERQFPPIVVARESG